VPTVTPTVLITVNNIWTHVESDDPDVHTLLNDEFGYKVPNAERTPAFKMKKWDGYKRLYTRYHNFPTGLLNDAIDALDHHRVKIVDKRVRPVHEFKPWSLHGAEEREHQTEAIVAALEDGRGIIHHATGAGKTEVMAAVIQMIDLKSLVLVHQKSIAEQTRARIKERLGLKKVGLYSSGKRIDAPITVATFQTLQSALDEDKANKTTRVEQWMKQFDVMCIDEAHHSSARTFQNVINTCPAYYRYGFSATPMRTEDRPTYLHIVGSTGPVIDRFTAGEGVEKGYLVKANITMVKWHKDKPQEWWKPADFDIIDYNYTYSGKKTELVTKTNGKQYRKLLPPDKWEPGLYEVAIVKNKTRNGYVVDAIATLVDDGLTVLVLVERIDQGEYLKRAVEREIAGKVVFLQGGDDMKNREKGKKLLTDGKIQVLIATTIFDEGIDIPAIDGLVFAGGGKAQHRYIQRLGRGMRPKAGKTGLEVVDFYDTHSRIMWRHSEERLTAYKSDKGAYEVTIEEMTV
jgi:superfamily II DNA or RNA helicase